MPGPTYPRLHEILMEYIARTSRSGPKPNIAYVYADTEFGRVEVSHVDLNDGVVEGLRCLDVPAFSVQYHPEAAPGPHDATGLFTRFADLMGGGR